MDAPREFILPPTSRRTAALIFGHAPGFWRLLLTSPPGPREQFRNRNAERVGELCDVPQGHVPEAALDLADVSPVQIGLFSQAFLRPALGAAKLTDSLGERADGLIGDFLMLGPQPSSLKGCTLKVHSLKVTTAVGR